MSATVMMTEYEQAEQIFETEFKDPRYQKVRGSILKLIVRGIEQGEPDVALWVREQRRNRRSRVMSLDALRDEGVEKAIAPPMRASGTGIEQYTRDLSRAETDVAKWLVSDNPRLEDIADELSITTKRAKRLIKEVKFKLRNNRELRAKAFRAS